MSQQCRQNYDSSLSSIRETLVRMRKLETSTYQRPPYVPEPFNGLWRQQIVEWMYTLIKYCKLRHESATAGAYFLDMAVTKRLIESPDDYQLGAITALYLGLKVYDSPTMRVVKLSSLVKLGNGQFDEKDVIKLEGRMLQALEWRLNPPTMNCFVQQYLNLLPCSVTTEARNRVEALSLGAIEACTARDFFSATKPSILAYAAMLLSIDQMDPTELSNSQLCIFMDTMGEVAGLSKTNPVLYKASVLLDRSMRSLPIPVDPIPNSVADSSQTSSVSASKQQQQSAHTTSPNTVSTIQ